MNRQVPDKAIAALNEQRRGLLVQTSAIGGLIGVALAVGGLALYYQPWADNVWWGGEDPRAVAAGRAVYDRYCANCHGAKLEGQPRWQELLPSGRLPAPPHDASGHTWHHPDRLLFDITKYGTAAVVGGDYQSDMSAFKDVLSDDEILAVLTFIKSTWPARERTYQRERTAARNKEQSHEP